MSSSKIDSLWLNIKQNAEMLREFVNDKTGLLDMKQPSNEIIKSRINLPIPGTHSYASNTTLKQSLVSTKEFFLKNKQDILRLLGLTVSAAVSYYAIKWALNAMDPTHKEKQLAKSKADQLLKEIGVSHIELNEYEFIIASNIVAPHNIDCTWEDIGGLDDVIDDIRETVIYPLKNNYFKNSRSTLMQAPKGVLLFGPPGNAKTMIAKALAKESGARFINLNVSVLFDKWYGESQKRTDAVFSLAQKIQPVIIFIDEIESFLRSRKSMDHECTVMMKTQFMQLWDGLTTKDNNKILIVGATNRPQDVDPAILRRMPALFNIKMPNEIQRSKILSVILKNEDLDDDVKIEELANRSFDFSGSDLKELCRCAAMNSFVRHMKGNGSENDGEEPIRIGKIDFEAAFEKLKVKNLTKFENAFEFNY